jgi:hypothetical protein
MTLERRVCIFIPFPDLRYLPSILLACARERALYRKIYRVRQGESTSRFNGTLLASFSQYQQRKRGESEKAQKVFVCSRVCACLYGFLACEE